MPSPATVWLARPGDPRTREGTLSIEGGRLTFVAEDGERIGVPRGSLEGVRRLRGTPVVEVRYRRESTMRLLLLYFVEPPPLADRSTKVRPGERGMRRIAAIRGLRAANRRLKPVIDAWVRAIREGS